MPFANLPTHEKDAFFALLDEYFTSRPDLLARTGNAAQTAPSDAHTPGAAVASAAQRAIAKNPAAASRLLVAGISHANTTPGPGASASSDPTSGAAVATAAQRAIAKNPAAASRLFEAGINHANNSPGNSATAAGNNDQAPGYGVGRVAAATQAFSAPPRKSTSPPVAQKGPDANKLTAQKKFGDVDVSSAGAMFRSLRGSTAAKNAPPPTVYTPPAFAGKKASSGLPPPPIRRVSTSTSASSAHVPEPEEDAPQPEPMEEEEEKAGEWAEALYDYTSQEASDLHLQEGERVLVTEKTSSDWWTGQVDGRSGLFPALYVKLL